MGTVIDRMLESVEWTPEPGATAGATAGADPSVPFVTHRGSIVLLGCTLRVYRLSDGRKIVDAEDLEAMLTKGPIE